LFVNDLGYLAILLLFGKGVKSNPPKENHTDPRNLKSELQNPFIVPSDFTGHEKDQHVYFNVFPFINSQTHP